jgi:serine/threonine protein kinase
MKLIAKHVRDRSNEPNILKCLHSQSLHVISLVDTVPATSTTGEWLILPKLRSICDQGFMNSRGVSGRVQLGCGLVKGLAFLHEHKVAHRDIKPDNLVCDDTFCLKIIDFDAAIEVEDENTEVDEYRGTKGWTAPEMRTRDGLTPMHSPIKADRWSCGRVLLLHIMVGTGDSRLSMFARRLIANDPQQRPSLLEWQSLFAAPFSGTANVLKDGGKEVARPWQDTAEGDGENMKPPDAKKRRLEPRGLQIAQPMGEVF